MIQSYPAKKRYFTQFTSVSGALEGPALIERSNGRRDVGVYKNDRQENVWKLKHTDGSVEIVVFLKGKIVEKK